MISALEASGYYLEGWMRCMQMDLVPRGLKARSWLPYITGHLLHCCYPSCLSTNMSATEVNVALICVNCGRVQVKGKTFFKCSRCKIGTYCVS